MMGIRRLRQVFMVALEKFDVRCGFYQDQDGLGLERQFRDGDR